MTKKLENIISNIKGKVKGPVDMDIRQIAFDSRNAGKGDLFVAVRGTQSDGHQFILSAVEAGAVAVICEKIPEEISSGVTTVLVEDSAMALGLAAAAFYDHPSSSLKLIGITGTNGKTSIATLLHRLFTCFDYKSGLISTVRYLVGEKEFTATHTTPDSLAIQKLLKNMVDEGCQYAFMEVSSHALDQNRSSGLEFDLAAFTNLTHDHLDYHNTFAEYLKAKKKLFDGLSSEAVALVNTDDKNGKVMVQNTRADIKTYGLQSMADYKAKIIESHFDGMLIKINTTELWTRLIGRFNASNLLAVFAIANLMGLPERETFRILSTLGTVDGRFEYLRSDNRITAIVDYAHTPDALMNVIDTINNIRRKESSLITVVGAGGDRDRTKRPVMGEIASERSTRVIFTSDNPRGEDPDSIIKDIVAGVKPDKMKNVLTITDRREAIRTACMLAKEDDVVLIAGKGHETYQEVKGRRSYFNDKQIVSEIFMINKTNSQ